MAARRWFPPLHPCACVAGRPVSFSPSGGVPYKSLGRRQTVEDCRACQASSTVASRTLARDGWTLSHLGLARHGRLAAARF
eukprot:6085908-Pyramimonas_sp.AAC.1